ncbi:hypothetical protein B0H19DRAFT_1123397 [Mycena capillaripes]|nr:hypothetical protein B0H19DRAFT_1123397 [Mycena capillaripes]
MLILSHSFVANAKRCLFPASPAAYSLLSLRVCPVSGARGIVAPVSPPAVFCCNLNLQLHQCGELHRNFFRIGMPLAFDVHVASSFIRPPTRYASASSAPTSSNSCQVKGCTRTVLVITVPSFSASEFLRKDSVVVMPVVLRSMLAFLVFPRLNLTVFLSVALKWSRPRQADLLSTYR